MKRQLLLALTTLAAGAALGLISPAHAQAYPRATTAPRICARRRPRRAMSRARRAALARHGYRDTGTPTAAAMPGAAATGNANARATAMCPSAGCKARMAAG